MNMLTSFKLLHLLRFYQQANLTGLKVTTVHSVAARRASRRFGCADRAPVAIAAMPDLPHRPSITHRHSSASVTFAKTPNDTLSSSVQKQKTSRHVVGQGRTAPRVPSYAKNINKLAKHTAAARAPDVSTSPRTGHANYDSSLAHVEDVASNAATDGSSAVLRKNHSETSLRKNRSGGQLVKLARPASSRNVYKSGRKLNKRNKSSSTTHLGDGPTNHTVRFDLGDREGHQGGGDDASDAADGEGDGWSNYSDSRSPSMSRTSTRQSSAIGSPKREREKEVNEEEEDPAEENPHNGTVEEAQLKGLEQGGGHAQIMASPILKNGRSHLARQPDADRITSRLLRRNVSFSAAPQLSDNAATPVIIDPHGTIAEGHTILNDASNPEVISRFLAHTSSTSTTPFDSNFLPAHSPRESQTPEDENGSPKRNKSLPNFAAMRVSRTQQRLNLERESVALEPPGNTAPPISLMRASRMSSASIPFYAASSGADGRLHPQIRQLFDQTTVEYRRIRMYQNPLAEALTRSQSTGKVSRPQTATNPKPGSKGGIQQASTLASTGDGRLGLSQSWRSQKSAKNIESSATTTKDNAINKRPRVMFQGIKDDEDADKTRQDSLDGAAEQRYPRHKDEARELCRRLWDKVEITSGE